MKWRVLLVIFIFLGLGKHTPAQSWEGWHPTAWTSPRFAEPVTISAWVYPVTLTYTNHAKLPDLSRTTGEVFFLSSITARPEGDTIPPRVAAATGTWSVAVWRNVVTPGGTVYTQVNENLKLTDLFYVKTNISLQPREIVAFDVYNAMCERWWSLVYNREEDLADMPRFYRDPRDTLVAAKQWVAANMGSYVDRGQLDMAGTLNTYFESHHPYVWGPITNVSGQVTTNWNESYSPTVPTYTKSSLMSVYGGPQYRAIQTVTGTVEGWRLGQLGTQYLTQRVYTQTNILLTALDVTPARSLDGFGEPYPATSVWTYTFGPQDCFFDFLDRPECWLDCSTCSGTYTSRVCGQDVVWTVTGEATTNITVTCTNYAPGYTSADYGWWSVRRMLTNMTHVVWSLDEGTSWQDPYCVDSFGVSYLGMGGGGGCAGCTLVGCDATGWAPEVNPVCGSFSPGGHYAVNYLTVRQYPNNFCLYYSDASLQAGVLQFRTHQTGSVGTKLTTNFARRVYYYARWDSPIGSTWDLSLVDGNRGGWVRPPEAIMDFHAMTSSTAAVGEFDKSTSVKLPLLELPAPSISFISPTDPNPIYPVYGKRVVKGKAVVHFTGYKF